MEANQPIVLHGTVLGRSVAHTPLTVQGHPDKSMASDQDVTLTLQFAVPNARPVEFSMRLDSLPRGWMEIGDPVVVTIDKPALPQPVVAALDAATEEETLP